MKGFELETFPHDITLSRRNSSGLFIGVIGYHQGLVDGDWMMSKRYYQYIYNIGCFLISGNIKLKKSGLEILNIYIAGFML
jgi:hypothetical protein